MNEQTVTKKNSIAYWVTTGIVAAIMLWSAYNFTFNATYKEAFHHLGLSNWFKVELTIAKILGIIALLVPQVPPKLKEFAYSGLAIVLLSTPVAHLSSGDSIWLELGHLFFFANLVVSYLLYHKIHKAA